MSRARARASRNAAAAPGGAKNDPVGGMSSDRFSSCALGGLARAEECDGKRRLFENPTGVLGLSFDRMPVITSRARFGLPRRNHGGVSPPSPSGASSA